jgi:hypothetical protein
MSETEQHQKRDASILANVYAKILSWPNPKGLNEMPDKKLTRKCENCGKVFVSKPRTGEQKFCKNACRQAAYRRRKTAKTAKTGKADKDVKDDKDDKDVKDVKDVKE